MDGGSLTEFAEKGWESTREEEWAMSFPLGGSGVPVGTEAELCVPLSAHWFLCTDVERARLEGVREKLRPREIVVSSHAP